MQFTKAGTTDESVTTRIVDSADFTPETGVTSGTSGLALWYRRKGGLKVAITPASLTNLNDAHTDGGILHISDGYYRIDLPDAAVAAGADYVDVAGSVTNMIMIGMRVQLTGADLRTEVTATRVSNLDNLDATVSSRGTADPGDAMDLVADAVDATALAANAVTEIAAGITIPTANAIADQVWDEVLSGHLTVGTTGAALQAAGGAGDPWSTLLPDGYTAGTAGFIIGGLGVDEIATSMSNQGIDGTTISIRRGDTYELSFSNLGILTGYTSLWFTVKAYEGAEDTEAIIQVKKNASALSDGLLYINGTVATSSEGSITIDDATTGDITIALDENATKLLMIGAYKYDVQVLNAGDVTTLTTGTANVVADYTRAII